jgi:hypothetical protein
MDGDPAGATPQALPGRKRALFCSIVLGGARRALYRYVNVPRKESYMKRSALVGEEDYPIDADGIRLLERGLRQGGVWPSEDFGAAFRSKLEKAIGAATDEQERTKLEWLRDAAKALGGKALNTLIGTAIGIGCRDWVHADGLRVT